MEKSITSIYKVCGFRLQSITLILCIICISLSAQPVPYCSGLMDNYVCPEEPVSPDPALLNLLTGQNAANPCFGLLEFDNFPGLTKCNGTDIPDNALFIHQLTFPVSGNVTAAILQFRAKAAPSSPPGAGQSNTDFIAFFEGATYITGANLIQLPEAGGTWNPNQDASFTLNLGNLPAVFSNNDILQYLNDGDLDIVIGNETGVDWMCIYPSSESLCCIDSLLFYEKVAQGFTVVTDPALCKATVTAPQFDSCHWFTTPPHLQGANVPQVITATDGMWMFNFTQSGGYTICVDVYEENATGICWQKEMCTTFDLNCMPGTGSVTGVKYLECGDLPYTDQPTLSGWVFELLNDASEVIALDTSDNDGEYAFSDLPAGNYVVREPLLPGWTPKVPVTGEYAITIDTGSQLVRNFGNCQDCYCGSFTDMYIRTVPGAPSTAVVCGGDPITLECPSQGIGFVMTGVFGCQGDICSTEHKIDWNLTGPAGLNISDSFFDNDPYWGINLLPGYFSQPGLYTLTLTGHCGSDDCSCVIKFNVNCPNLCPCEPSDLVALQAHVKKGFAYSLASTTCKACFSPIALSECETVEWFLNSTSGTPIGTSKGKQTFCTTFTDAGTYNVFMKVTRKKADGSICGVFTKSQSVTVTCGIGQDCSISVLENSSFDVNPVAGGLGSGGMGMAPGWEAAVGNPLLLSGQTGSHDEWTMMLTGNYDEADVLSSVETICISKTDTGTISLRLAGEPIPGAIVNVGRKPPGSNNTIILYQGGTAPYPNCTGGGCYELATLTDLLPLDPGDWYEVKIPYDLSDWTAMDTCEDVSGGVPVRLAVYVSNYLSDEQGDGPTHHGMQVDNICFNGMLVAVDNPVRKHSISLFPNPTSGDLTLQFKGTTPKAGQLKILDLWGRVVHLQTLTPGQQEHTFSLSSLPGSVYFVKVLEDGVPVWVEKVVKQ